MNRWIRFTPAILWMAVIFLLSHQTGEQLGSLLPLFQQWIPAMRSFDWGHFAAYFVLGVTYYWALLPLSYRWQGKAAVVLMAGLYGVTDEIHQMYVAGRTPDIRDLRNDVIGASLAVLVMSTPLIGRLLRKFVPR